MRLYPYISSTNPLSSAATPTATTHATSSPVLGARRLNGTSYPPQIYPHQTPHPLNLPPPLTSCPASNGSQSPSWRARHRYITKWIGSRCLTLCSWYRWGLRRGQGRFLRGGGFREWDGMGWDEIKGAIGNWGSCWKHYRRCGFRKKHVRRVDLSLFCGRGIYACSAGYDISFVDKWISYH